MLPDPCRESASTSIYNSENTMPPNIYQTDHRRSSTARDASSNSEPTSQRTISSFGPRATMEPPIQRPTAVEPPSIPFAFTASSAVAEARPPVFPNTGPSLSDIPWDPRQGHFPQLSFEEDPWSSLHTRNGVSRASSRPQNPGYTHPGPMYRQQSPSHRQALSDRGSLNSGTRNSSVLDSGYGSLPQSSPTKASYNGEIFSNQKKSEWASSRSTFPGTDFPAVEQDSLHSLPDHISEPVPGSGDILQCHHCHECFRSISQLKKHELKHTRPFHCLYQGCSKSGGFMTSNDLDRHSHSVHQIAPKDRITKVYFCAAQQCKKAKKRWPRSDNFRQHIRRMHPDQNVDDIVRRSERDAREHPPNNVDLFGPSKDDPAFSMGKNSDTMDSDEILNLMDLDPSLLSVGRDMNPLAAMNPSNIASSDYQDWQPSNGQEDYHKLETSRGPRSPSLSQDPVFNLDKLEPGSEPSCTLDSTTSDDPNDARISPEGYTGKSSVRETFARTGGTVDSLKKAKIQTTVEDEAIERLSDHIIRIVAKNMATTMGDNSLEAIDCGPRSPKIQDGSLDPSQSGGATSSSSLCSDSSTAELKSNERVRVTQQLRRHFSDMLRKELPGLKDVSNASGRSRTQSDSQFSSSLTSSKTLIQCHECPRQLSRNCDYNKHIKRHQKPWGCTFSGCFKVFGSKGDWKRHEISQHFHLEMWKCGLDVEGARCFKFFYHRDNFLAHLKNDHKIMQRDALRSKIKERRVGRNCQGQTWCGFCRKIFQLKQDGRTAWDDRFNHIEKHFKEKALIQDYMPSDMLTAKGHKPEGHSECSKDSSTSSPIDSSHTKAPVNHPSETESSEHTTDHLCIDDDDTQELSANESTRKRKRQRLKSSISPAPENEKPLSEVWYCCMCKEGPTLVNLRNFCMGTDCRHQNCKDCQIQFV